MLRSGFHRSMTTPLPRAVNCRRCLLPAVVAVLIASAAGCAAHRPQLQADLSAPGWRVWHGQAVWRSATGEPEIAGELLAGIHPSADSIVQFVKTPFQLVTAHQSGDRWQITFGSADRTFSGRGVPPSRFIWLHLASCIDSGAPPPKGWTIQMEGERWTFENRATGEMLEGYLRGP